MPDLHEVALESVRTLFSEVLSPNRFKKWRARVAPDAAALLSQYAFGEIFWKKSLGRPNTTKLSEAVTVEAWQDEEALVGDIGGGAHWVTFRNPRFPSWWDGKDDGRYWRVSYMVPNLSVQVTVDGLPTHFRHTYIVPHLKPDTSWNIPSGKSVIANTGFRTLEPPRVVFVKTEKSAHFSFEVVRKPLLVSP